MAEDTITSFTINTLLIGLLALALVSSYILLVNNEGHGDSFDSYPEIQKFNLDIQDTYTDGKILETANINSNLSADYNPEISLSGADQSGNAVSINLQNLITITWATLGVLGALLFGNIYTGILSGLIMAIVGFLSTAYLIKAIRTGYS